MLEEIITALSRIRWLFVIARNSSFSARGRCEAGGARTGCSLRAGRLGAQGRHRELFLSGLRLAASQPT
jgi:hypothetical protein